MSPAPDRATGGAANRTAFRSVRGCFAESGPARPAFTLLEVILSLALAGLLLGALTWAIQLNLKATTSGRNDVERAQLARAALDRMAADIRGAVWYDPIDPNSLVTPPSSSSLTSTSSSGGSSGGGGSGGSATGASTGSTASSGSSTGGGGSSRGGSGGGGSGGSSGGSRGSSGGSSTGGSSMSGSSTGGSSTGGSSMSGSSMSGGGSSASGSSSSSTTETTTTPLPQPGLFGGTNWLQVDVSRLPRIDQYMISSTANPNAAFSHPSEIKSVFYFMAGSGQALPPALANATTGGDNQGLMRREADRLTTIWQTSGGGGQVGAGQAAEALAPEVQHLEFRYFNGSTFSNSWDSYEYGCLPRAIEIRMTLADNPAAGPNAASGAVQTLAQQSQPGNPAQYRIVVPIPAWKPPPLETTESTSGSSGTGGTNISGSGSF